MSLSCLCQKSSDVTEISDDYEYHEFQIANPQGKKWKAKGKKLHHEITLSMSVGKQVFWRFEREKDELLWSFHVLSKKGEKLYLSYREDSNEITLELKDDSDCEKKRFFRLFVALVQDNGRHLFRAHKTKDRYIGSDEDEKLKMFTTENPSENMIWLVRENLVKLESQESEIVVEIRHLNRKWISINAQSDQPIPVQQNGNNELWHMKINPGKWTFSPLGKSLLYASLSTVLTKMIVFAGQLGRSPALVEYKPMLGYGSSYRLQNLFSHDWVGCTGVGPGATLNLESEEKLCLEWDIHTGAFPYMRSSKTFLFPPVCMYDEDDKNDES